MKKYFVILLFFLVGGSEKAFSAANYTPITPARLGAYMGVETLNSLSTATLSVRLASATAAGIAVARMNTDWWNQIETASGTITWTKLDAVVATVTGTATGQGNMTFIFTFSMNPASSGSNGYLPIDGTCPSVNIYTGASVGCNLHPTTDIGAYKWFVGQVVTRYSGPSVKFESPNEMDHPSHIFVPGGVPSASIAATYWKATYEAAKAANPSAEVWAGAIAFPSGVGLPGATTTYTRGSFFYNALVTGATSCTLVPGPGTGFCGDKVSIHVYQHAGETFEVAVSTMLLHLAAVGTTDVEVVVTETADFGTTTYPDADVASWENRKVNWLVGAYPRALGMLGVEAIIWHTLNYGDFGLIVGSTETTSYVGHQTFFDQHENAVYVSTEDFGTNKITRYQQSDGPVWTINKTSGTGKLQMRMFPPEAQVIQRDGTSATYDAQGLMNVDLSTNPVIVHTVIGNKRVSCGIH